MRTIILVLAILVQGCGQPPTGEFSWSSSDENEPAKCGSWPLPSCPTQEPQWAYTETKEDGVTYGCRPIQQNAGQQ